VDGTRLVFISTHLCAHEGVKKCAARNDSIREILGGVRSKIDDNRFDPTLQAHHAFWMGDMNYRVTLHQETPKDDDKTRVLLKERMKEVKQASEKGKVSDKHRQDEEEEEETVDGGAVSPADDARQQELDHVAKMIEEEKWAELLELDELNREIKANRVLQGKDGYIICVIDSVNWLLNLFLYPLGFVPHQPRFPPTFKRVRHKAIQRASSPGSKQWQTGLNAKDKDSRFYNLQRMPSYTDRVLTKSLSGFADNLELSQFDSCEDVLSSDHKPVRAFFELQTTQGWAAFEASARTATEKPAKKMPITISISEMKARDLAVMDVNGSSDPYIQIFTDPPELLHKKSRLVSSVKRKNLNPDWGSETLSVVINSDDLDNLSVNSHLFFSIWDEDQFVRDFSFDHDLIGLFSISMKSIIEKARSHPQKEFVIDELLVSNGCLTGSLSFKVLVDFPNYLGIGTETRDPSYYISDGDSTNSARPAACCMLS
jgi:hypothetical protein